MFRSVKSKFYTLKRREVALKNISKYDWAKKIVNEVAHKADALLPYVDTLCDLIPSEGFPRSNTLSTVHAKDDVMTNCPYCGVSIAKVTRNGAWYVNAIEHPWKVGCPNCKNLFPSNDFGLLYKRGLNEKGEYDRALAIKNNAEAVARGEKDALVNELFSDKDKLWMVDDGFGWSKEEGTYDTSNDNKWAPVAYYHHQFWLTLGDNTSNAMFNVLTTLRDSYLYTGKEVYGNACLKLLKRVADLYPAYDFKKVSLGYSASHGLSYNGKIVGSIWEHYIAECFIRTYDALIPLMDDKTREYIKENIVRESFRGVKARAICGNFGMHQKVAALAAVALDDENEINEIIKWLMAPGGIETKDIVCPIYGDTIKLYYNSQGGELFDKYINDIDHDGFGGEIAITYNKEWFISTLDIAEILSHCKYTKLDLFKNPKFVKMFDTFMHETTANGTSLALGDSGYTVSIVYPFAKEMLRGYNILRDPKMAQAYHFYMNGDLSSIYIDMFTDAEELSASIQRDIEMYGPYHFESDNLTGFGLTVLREGQHYYDAEKQYDTWMYYGRTNQAHAHLDMLHFGIDAYGVNITPDLGYPEKTGFQPNRYEWAKATISHNTVVVNGESQTEQYSGKSQHYDSTDIVKLVDVDGSVAYAETDIYRRTLVTIAVDDTIGYTLDFFRVKGGDSHMYSFHTQSDKGYTSNGVKFTPQVDADGNYIGTYASPDFERGHDPASSDVVRAEKTHYTRGYTWLTHVDKGSVDSGYFTIDFAIQDFRNHAKDSQNVHLRFTALNDWIPDAVDLTRGYPPQKKINDIIPGLDYMFIHRKGSDLDTLYTSLLQPYKGEAYIAKAESVTAIVKEGVEGTDDLVKAVKVTLVNGLTDYVVYATNNQVTYHIADDNVCFEFRGFVGVYRVDETGKCVYAYINDGDLLAGVISQDTTVAAYEGTVVDFTKEFVDENSIVVRFDNKPIGLNELVGRYIYVASTSERNTVYRIEDVSMFGDNIVLHLGNTTVIEGLVDKQYPEKGYVYAIEEGQRFRIPVSTIKNGF